jgi:hypothetical protein
MTVAEAGGGAALVDAELVPFGIRHDHEVAVFP